MKKLLLLFFILMIPMMGHAQDFAEDVPVSWQLNLQQRNTPIELPPLDLEAVHAEDAVNDLDKSQPWRYGITRPVAIDIEKDGVWTTLPNNAGRLWQVAIKSTDAINLSVNLDAFYIPKGARFFLFNGDQSDVSVPYTDASNRSSNNLGSWFLQGDVIWLEYYEPPYISEDVQLTVTSVIHGYRMGNITTIAQNIRGLNDSGSCNFDVNCSIGADFDDLKDVIKKAITLLNLGNGYLCTASLVNNTAADKTPFLLTANHCLQDSNPEFWSVRFNWISPTPVCGEEAESADIQTNFTMSGGQVRASNTKSDFALVELFNRIPESWDIAFAGWNNSDAMPQFEVGIHHPNGDIMKVCRDNSGATKDVASGTDVWLIGGGAAGTGNGWEIGTTESGSSGSPLFNEKGHIIGQLYGGQSFCDGTSNNGQYDIYGRFAVSWDFGDTPETRLKDWLDPINSGQTTIETLQNILNVQDIELTGTLEIFPNPANTYITVMNSRYPNLSYQFFNVLGQQIVSGSVSNTMNVIQVATFTEGIYFLRLKDEESNQEITKKILIQK
ncbi:T9SS type A sorting domain-containing protein [Altibacter lentus]|uniref:T9SS type A sorting domain-containing protein n=1 Tax=Altibacter lentus TaxID=1223410 RepID=UPI0009FD843C|nr:T9SS type A sorting domain-containing protein [Altibacter lentus]